METSTLLIADNSEEVQLALTNALHEHYHIHCCADGRQALMLLRELSPELFVLDLVLPELDGISLLKKAKQEGICPRVIALSPIVSDYIDSVSTELEVAYLIRKPCDLQATAELILEIDKYGKADSFHREITMEIQRLLLALQISPKYKGYHYLRESIALVVKQPVQSVTKELYPAVAQCCNVEPQQVERSIRNALCSAWNNRDSEIWQAYFPKHTLRCPSNATFISRMAEVIR